MTAPTPELIPLIYRHLKEHGFTTAADELQKLSPQPQQEEVPTSTTLLDIYKNWIRNAKRRKKPATAQASSPNQKQTTPKKAVPRKKTDKTISSKPESPSKKATPTCRKKGEGKTTVKVVKPQKADAGGDGSDSDSSLDVEKWKKLVQEMTDTDLDKVAALNALATPGPKQPRPRKPRAKPKPQTEAAVNGQGQQNEKPDESAENVSTKRNHSRKAVPVAALENLNKEQISETPVAAVTSTSTTSKRTPKKEKRKASDKASVEPKPKKKKESIQNNLTANVTDGERLTTKNSTNKDDKLVSPTKKSPEHTPEIQTETKKKKKKKEMDPNVSVNTTDEGGLNEKNRTDNIKDGQMVNLTQTGLKEGGQEDPSNFQTEPKKKKKKKAHKETLDSNVCVANVESTVEDLNGNNNSLLNAGITEAAIKVKKKKKRSKEKDDGYLEQIVTETNAISVCNEVICETTEEKANSNTEIHKKKKKKKDKDKSETLQQTEKSVIDEAVCIEENTDQLVVKKKSKKKKRQSEEHLGTQDKTATTEGSELPEELPDPPSTPLTPSSKKKKHRLEELITADATADADPQTLDIETPKKKKKKSSKSKETETES